MAGADRCQTVPLTWGIDLTGLIHSLPMAEHGRRRRLAAHGRVAALAVALAFLAGPTDAAPGHAKTHRHGGAAKHVPAEKPPSGPLTIVVSIGSQHVSLYADGAFVGRGPVSTGMHGHPTPVGIFTVIQKDRYHRSNIYSAAPMPFMQRITWSGVAIHQGVLPGYPASHGCIRTSADFAVRLWGITKLGARVIVARSDPAPAAIANPHLFAPRSDPAPDPKPEPAVASAPAATRVVLPAADRGLADPDDFDNPGDIRGSEPIRASVAESADPPAINVAKAAADAGMQAEAARKPGAVSAFVSRKTGRLYVRQNYQPLFDVPVEIRDPERPLGTHVFTALEPDKDGKSMRWSVVTIPGEAPIRAEHQARHGGRKSRQEREPEVFEDRPSSSAGEALNRIEMPQEAIERVSELLTPGSSLIVSDRPMSDETGRDTDFIILTH
jgi:hypothetical protein